MKEQNHQLARPWTLMLGGAVLVTSHLIFFSGLRHAGVPLAAVSVLVLLVIAKHVGVAGSLYGLFRGRSRH